MRGPMRTTATVQNLHHGGEEEFFHRLEPDDHAVFDEEIDSIARINLDPVVQNWKPQLVLECNPILSQLIAKARVVSAFETSSSERRMDFHRSAKNPFRDRIVQHGHQ
jgi:hypothetical protein